MDEPTRDPIRERARARLGLTLRGKFRLDALLGVGGMASVYAATHRNGNRVAIKILHEHVSMNEDVRRLFRREGLAANRIDHPGVVTILDDDVTEDGCGYLVMPLLAGETLQARLDRLGGSLGPRDVLLVGYAVLDVLAAAHAQRVVHRDVKPDNLFITDEGDLRVLDFGVARVLESAEGAGGGTRAGQAIGTPGYMAPEQALGRGAEVDAQSDLWAMGATLFRSLSGEHAHGAATSSELVVFAATRPARPLRSVVPAVPAVLADVIDRALAFDKKDRWPDARAMQAALADAVDEVAGGPVAMPVRLDPPPSSVIRQAMETVTGPSAFEPPGGAGTPDLHSAVTHAEPAYRVPARVKRSGRAMAARVVGALALVALAGVGGRAAWRARSAPQVAPAIATPVEAGGATSIAREALAAGVQAFRDASDDISDGELRRAIKEDPTLGSAYVILVLHDVLSPSQDTRDVFQEAWKYRGALPAADVALLEAYAPSMELTPDLEKTRANLEATCRRFPEHSVCAYVLATTQIRMGKLDEAGAVLDALLARDPTFAAGWFMKATGRIFASDTAGALAAYQECLRISPYSTKCTDDLMRLDANEGECAEVERLARTELRAAPRSFLAFQYLAGALAARGSLDAARVALAQGWEVVHPDSKARYSANQKIELAILEGKFDEALAHARELDAAQISVKDEEPHAVGLDRLARIALELGDRSTAVRLADAFDMQRDAWERTEAFDYGILPDRVRYLAGAMSRPAFVARRAAWLESESKRPASVGIQSIRWILAYAGAVATADDAREAIRVLPQFGPMLDPQTRDLEVDYAIGHAYLRAGDRTNALTFLTRAARSCRPLVHATDSTQAQLDLGELHGESGQSVEACAAYRIVLDRWGREPRSISARRALRNARALGCSAPR